MSKRPPERLRKDAPQDDTSLRHTCLPKEGFSKEVMDQELDRYSSLPHTRWEKGRVSGVVYHHDTELTNLAARAYKTFMSTNPIHTDVFLGVHEMEAEVVAMVADMFHAASKAEGTLTSGGWFRVHFKVMSNSPRMGTSRQGDYQTLDDLSHYDPSCVRQGRHLFWHQDDVTMQVDLKAVRRANNNNVNLFAGSVNTHPHDIMHDIVALGERDQKHNIRLNSASLFYFAPLCRPYDETRNVRIFCLL
ncbi:MAG: pyridoxal phosphate-dependent transferase [Linnemannia gamsii]|nr:MAG: pyridoxal phosphate-dependent transferase [Linnemannia gamsii]